MKKRLLFVRRVAHSIEIAIPCKGQSSGDAPSLQSPVQKCMQCSQRTLRRNPVGRAGDRIDFGIYVRCSTEEVATGGQCYTVGIRAVGAVDSRFHAEVMKDGQSAGGSNFEKGPPTMSASVKSCSIEIAVESLDRGRRVFVPVVELKSASLVKDCAVAATASAAHSRTKMTVERIGSEFALFTEPPQSWLTSYLG